MSFKAVEGQDRAVLLLKKALQAKKIHHAYLFSGVDGVGKKKTALELAKALNCLQTGPEGSCDRCDVCLKIDKAGHPDVLHLQSEGSQIRIHQIRTLEEQINFPPYMGGTRMCLVDKASDLNVWAANAFLKTLEEPPEGNVFVLLVNDPGDILPTLVSRCLPVQFNLLPSDLISRKLREQGVGEEEARTLGRISGGSLGRALAFRQADFQKKQQSWIQQLEALSMSRLSPMLEEIKKWLGSREEMLQQLEIGRACLRDILWTRLGMGDRLLLAGPFRDRLAGLAGRHGEAVWLERMHLVNQAEEHLAAQANPQLTWEMLWIRMARASRD